MKGFLQDIIIGVLIFVICLVIAIVTGANFLWLLLPLVVIVLLATLGNLLRQRYGSTYGITVYLFLFLVVPILWYLFCSQMPITAVTLKTQQKAEDFSSFKNYEGSIDAKQQFVDYQLRQDSVLKQEIARLLQENNVDEALKLLKQHEEKNNRLKDELFSNNNKTNSINETHQNEKVDVRYSTTGATETIAFNKFGPPVKTSKIYMAVGQRFRIRSTKPCYVGTTKYYIPANQWIQVTTTIEGSMDFEGAGERGTATIEVL